MQNRNRLAIILSTVGALIVVGVLIVVNLPSKDQSDMIFSDLPQSLSADGHPILGNPDAPVTMRVYEDLGCPNCQFFWAETEPDVIENYVVPGLVKLEIFTIAFVNASSLPGAEAIACANDQGHFWEYREILFHNQGVRAFDRSNLVDWAEDIGLDRSEFSNCFDLGRHQSEVIDRSQAAFEFGISGTPTSVINGVRYVGVLPFLSTDPDILSIDVALTEALVEAGQ